MENMHTDVRVERIHVKCTTFFFSFIFLIYIFLKFMDFRLCGESYQTSQNRDKMAPMGMRRKKSLKTCCRLCYSNCFKSLSCRHFFLITVAKQINIYYLIVIR